MHGPLETRGHWEQHDDWTFEQEYNPDDPGNVWGVPVKLEIHAERCTSDNPGMCGTCFEVYKIWVNDVLLDKIAYIEAHEQATKLMELNGPYEGEDD
jgi:hypothetical protein